MSEPLNPLAAGIASALKSLRARAGLRSDRLSDSDPAVGVLSGLVLVKELTGTGVPTGQAIVEVVTNAAKTLEPTDSIVADMSLALELSAPDMADSGLYANDLGNGCTRCGPLPIRGRRLRCAPCAWTSKPPRSPHWRWR
jgi:ribosomal protein L37E